MKPGYEESVINFNYGTIEASKVLAFLQKPIEDLPEQIHFTSENHPYTRTFHIEPGVTATVGYDGSIVSSPLLFVRLQGDDVAKKRVIPILERTLDIKLTLD